MKTQSFDTVDEFNSAFLFLPHDDRAEMVIGDDLSLTYADSMDTEVQAALAKVRAGQKPSQKTFPALVFMQTMFTPAEQTALATAAQGNAQVLLFMLFVASAGEVDVGNPQVIANVNAVRDAGLLTADRASQILAGTPAPTG